MKQLKWQLGEDQVTEALMETNDEGIKDLCESWLEAWNNYENTSQEEVNEIENQLKGLI